MYDVVVLKSRTDIYKLIIKCLLIMAIDSVGRLVDATNHWILKARKLLND
jgi:hypothetical protein